METHNWKKKGDSQISLALNLNARHFRSSMSSIIKEWDLRNARIILGLKNGSWGLGRQSTIHSAISTTAPFINLPATAAPIFIILPRGNVISNINRWSGDRPPWAYSIAWESNKCHLQGRGSSETCASRHPFRQHLLFLIRHWWMDGGERCEVGEEGKSFFGVEGAWLYFSKQLNKVY